MSSSETSDPATSSGASEQHIAETNFFGVQGVQVPDYQQGGTSSDEESTDGSSGSGSERSEHLETLPPNQDDQAEIPESSGLPCAGVMFSEVSGPPAFLNPEATRPLASNPVHGRVNRQVPSVERDGHLSSKPKPRKRQGGDDFDVSTLAPSLGPPPTESSKRGIPEGAVIEAKAKKYKSEDQDEGPGYTSQQIALMGGNVEDGNGDEKVGTSSMNVSEFLGKGGGVALPRKNRDRRDREKDKRSRGQSSHSEWKSEAEMVLRQQYD